MPTYDPMCPAGTKPADPAAPTSPPSLTECTPCQETPSECQSDCLDAIDELEVGNSMDVNCQWLYCCLELMGGGGTFEYNGKCFQFTPVAGDFSAEDTPCGSPAGTTKCVVDRVPC